MASPPNAELDRSRVGTVGYPCHTGPRGPVYITITQGEITGAQMTGMAQSSEPGTDEPNESVYRAYVLDVRIIECNRQDDADPGPDERRYRFEAPNHRGETFTDPAKAELYADVYFDVNGFQEAGTGERGIPPVMFQAGRDTIAAYLYTRDHVDLEWLGSFFAHKPAKAQRMIDNVRKRAESIREGARERGME